MSRFTDLFQTNTPELADSSESVSAVSDVNVEKPETKETKVVSKWKSRKKSS